MPDISTRKYDAVQLVADTNWQIAKGHLNAMVAVHGACHTGGTGSFEEIKGEVDSFIKRIEDLEWNL